MVTNQGIEVLLEGGGWESYCWNTAQIGVSKDSRLYIRRGSGCSCNDISDEYWEPFTSMDQVHLAARKVFPDNWNSSWDAPCNDPALRGKFIADAQGIFARY